MPVNQTVFYIIFGALCCQRLAELLWARSNERWLRARGAQEFGHDLYPVVVLLHACFFLSLFLETGASGFPLLDGWRFALTGLLVAQVLRYWILFSLGRRWNTKVFVIPGEQKVSRGPYKFLNHPNYAVVVLELLLIPLIFKAWITLIWANSANAVILYFRIKQEEEALALLE